jgi:hypothetical protein
LGYNATFMEWSKGRCGEAPGRYEVVILDGTLAPSRPGSTVIRPMFKRELFTVGRSASRKIAGQRTEANPPWSINAVLRSW